MAGIKSSILRRMDTAPAGVRICCVKFVQRVVQVQTPGLISDPRVRSHNFVATKAHLLTRPQRPEQNEASLALVPRDHPIIPPSNLEAEASGLLDRLLSVLQDDSRFANADSSVTYQPLTIICSEALIVTATLNTLSTLVRSRASIANKIVATILTFNPFRLANGPMTSKDKVMLKSMTKTAMVFLTNIIKKYEFPHAAQLT